MKEKKKFPDTLLCNHVFIRSRMIKEKHISVLPVGQCMQSLIFIYGINQTTFQAEGVLENCGGFISKKLKLLAEKEKNGIYLPAQ